MEICGLVCEFVARPGREIWLLLWLKGIPGRLEKPCCSKLPLQGLNEDRQDIMVTTGVAEDHQGSDMTTGLS